MSMFADAPGAAPTPAPDSVKFVDVDWNMGVIASSSELQAVGTTFVQLRFHVEKPDGSLDYAHLGARARR